MAYNNRGLAKAKLSDYKGAIADYDQALQIDPQFAGACNNRGIAKAELSDYKGAIADFEQTLQIDPQLAMAYNNRGRAKAMLDKDKEWVEIRRHRFKRYYETASFGCTAYG